MSCLDFGSAENQTRGVRSIGPPRAYPTFSRFRQK